MQFADDVVLDFWSVTTTPMAWGNWFRFFGVAYRPFVQSLWPAALLIASIHFYRPRRGAVRLALALSLLFLVYAGLQAALQIGWSENYRPFVALYRFLDFYATDFVAGAFLAVALLCWILSRRLGLAAAWLALIAVTIMYWAPSPVTRGNWLDDADDTNDTRRMVFDIPTVHGTPALAITLFIGGMFGSALLVFRRHVRPSETLGCLLLLPLLLESVAKAGAFLRPLSAGPLPYWYWIAGPATGIGIACLFWSILKRTDIERSPQDSPLAS